MIPILEIAFHENAHVILLSKKGSLFSGITLIYLRPRRVTAEISTMESKLFTASINFPMNAW